jgi:hypothetical protein
MAEHATNRTVDVTQEDRVLASAHITTAPDTHSTVHATLRAEAGHLPAGTRANLVDTVLDLPEVHGSTHMTATVPLGDAESLHALQARTTDMRTRSAGCTAIIDADLPDAPDAEDTDQKA